MENYFSIAVRETEHKEVGVVIKEAIATGSTVEEAKEAALSQLGVESYEAEFEVLDLPVRKTFGLFGGSPARVRAFIKVGPAEAAADYLRNILNCMNLGDVKLNIQEEAEGALLSLTGDEVGFIIGHRGETLDALQYLAGLVANHTDNAYYRITLDIGNYRKKRQETLEQLGKKIAAKALRIGRNCALEPMNPYERRIIHTAVQTVEGAKSWSEGEDLARHVVIGPIEGERPLRRPGFGSRPPRRNNFNSRPATSAPARPGFRPPAEPKQPPRGPRPDEGKAPLYGRIDVKK